MGVHFLSQYRNPLAYPAGYAPGFNLQHPAARRQASGRTFAVVPNGGNMVDLVSGQRGTVTNGPAGVAIDGLIGPVMTTSVNAHTRFTKGSDDFTQLTLAVIVKLNSIALYNVLLTADQGSSSLTSTGSSGEPYVGLSANINFTGAAFEAGTPAFCAFSFDEDNDVYNWVMTNLKTGKILTHRGTSTATINNTTSVFCVGNLGSGGYPAHNLAAAYVGMGVYLSPSEMRQWAADPWSFWYPNPGDNWIAAQAAVAAGKFSWQMM